MVCDKAGMLFYVLGGVGEKSSHYSKPADGSTLYPIPLNVLNLMLYF